MNIGFQYIEMPVPIIKYEDGSYIDIKNGQKFKSGTSGQHAGTGLICQAACSIEEANVAREAGQASCDLLVTSAVGSVENCHWLSAHQNHHPACKRTSLCHLGVLRFVGIQAGLRTWLLTGWRLFQSRLKSSQLSTSSKTLLNKKQCYLHQFTSIYHDDFHNVSICLHATTRPLWFLTSGDCCHWKCSALEPRRPQRHNGGFNRNRFQFEFVSTLKLDMLFQLLNSFNWNWFNFVHFLWAKHT